MKHHIVYKKIPGVFLSYLKMLIYRRRGFKPGDTLPKIKVSVNNISVNKDRLKKYMEICGFKDNGFIPLLYPHVFSAPKHMAILSHKLFPIPVMGTLHFRNHSIQHRPIRIDEALDIDVELIESRIVKQGLEFDYTIQVRTDGELVWESITTYLKKGKFGTDYQTSPNSDIIKLMPETADKIDLYIPENIGKRYARICSDYNPIHISRTAAKLSGFKRDIAHAMWATANAISKLHIDILSQPVRVDLVFKGPLFLDSHSHMTAFQGDEMIRFDYYCGDNPRPSINGQISYIEKGTHLF